MADGLDVGVGQRPHDVDDAEEGAQPAQLHHDPHLPRDRVAERSDEIDDVLVPERPGGLGSSQCKARSGEAL